MLFLPLLAWNQECPDVNSSLIVFSTQQEVEDFAENFPNCSELDYGLIITQGVEDLSPLSFLQKINGNLEIRITNNLLSLQGLDGLREITGFLSIKDNESLTDISALNKVTSVSTLNINANSSLTALTGFDSLKNIGGSLLIFSNKEIREISAFPNLESIEMDLKITREDALISITGFNKLREVGKQIQIAPAGSLAYILGFNDLEKVGSNLEIASGTLEHIDGFEKLDTIRGDFEITCFPGEYVISGVSNLRYIGGQLVFDKGLHRIEGFESLTYIGADFKIISSKGLKETPDFAKVETIGGTFQVYNNPDLQQLPAFSELSEIDGTVIITENQALTKLGSLHLLQKINGYLEIERNDSLITFDAFTNLDSIAWWVDIESNPSLVSLDGLENLKYIGQKLDIRNCASLRQIDALARLNFVGDRVHINTNWALESIKGLQSLQYIKDLQINSTNELETLEGLDSLQEVGKLVLRRHKKLKNIHALSSLEKISSGTLSIIDNEVLSDLSGLENLKSMPDGWIFIDGNENLQSITALDSLDVTELFRLYIENNRKLRYCNARTVCEFIAINSGSAVTIRNNASGCNNTMEILRYCTDNLPTVTGTAFIDQNCNSIQDTLDTVVPEVLLLESSTDMPFAITDSSGNYVRGLAFDTTAQYKLRSLNYFTVEPTQYSVMTADTIALYDSLDFSLCPIETIRDLNADLISLNPPRPGFVHEYELCIKNTGTTPETANISFSFTGEDNALWIDSLFIDGEKMSAANASWASVSIAPFARSCFNISVYLVPDESILGEVLLPKAVVELIGNQDNHPADNIDSLSLVIVGSYDPNDKRVSIDSLNFAEVDGQLYLEYTIRFQNTGTFMAEFIEVTDTINEDFDMTSFTMLSSSHNYQLKFKEDRLLSWFFPDIHLPPAAENELASNGYIKFGIKTKPGLKLADILSNKAFIYFDFNSPIITNEATTQFFTITSLSSIPNTFKAKIFPNPAKNYFTVEIDNLIGEQKIEFQLFSSDRKLIEQRSIPSSTDRFTVPISHLPPGIYLVQLSIGGQRIIHKMIK